MLPERLTRASAPARFLTWVLAALVGAMYFAMLPLSADAGAAPATGPLTGHNAAAAAAPADSDEDDKSNLDALTPVVVVFDVSGSMNDDDGTGQVKIATAKRVMYEALADGRMKAALWTYPGGTTQIDGCNAGQWMPGSSWQDNANATKVSADIRRISASGGTPTGPALKAVAQQLGTEQDVEIILVSDGQSNCGPPPCDVAKELIDQGYKIRVQPIGFDINEQESNELRCIADATEGQYFSAQDSAELTDYFQKLTMPPLNLTVQAPTIASNGGSVAITATVRNDLPDRSVRGARLQLTTRDTDDVLADRFSAPKRSLTTLAPGEQRSFTWLLSLKGNPGELNWKVSASAPSMESVQEKGVVTITDQALDWSTAGDLLSDISGQVVIMGDSYSSGEGIGEYDDGDYRACHQNHEKAYGGVIFDGKRDVANIACTGSTTRHFSEMYYDVRGEGVNYPAQLGELARLDDVGAVFLTIGGNDIEFAGVVADCLVPLEKGDSLLPKISRCVIEQGEEISWTDYQSNHNQIIKSMLLMENLYSEPWWNMQGLSASGTPLTPGDFGSLPELYVRINSLINSEERVRERGGKAPIIVSSYPMVVHEAQRGICGLENIGKALWEDASFALGATGEISAAEVQTLWLLAGELNDTVKRAVHTAKKYWDVPVYFVPSIETMALPGHSMCGDPQESYFVPVNLLTGIGTKIASASPFKPDWTSEIVHPNEKGHKKWAWDILAWSQGQLLPDEYLAKPAPPTATSPGPDGSTGGSTDGSDGSSNSGSDGSGSSGSNNSPDGDSTTSSGSQGGNAGSPADSGRVTWVPKTPSEPAPQPGESGSPGAAPTPGATSAPGTTPSPSDSPSESASASPSDEPSASPSDEPSASPSEEPSDGGSASESPSVDGGSSSSPAPGTDSPGSSETPDNPDSSDSPGSPDSSDSPDANAGSDGSGGSAAPGDSSAAPGGTDNSGDSDDSNTSGNGVPGVEPVVVPVEDLDYSPPSLLERKVPRSKVEIELELQDLEEGVPTPVMEDLKVAAERGAPVDITVRGLAPGSRLSAYLRPHLSLLDNAYADENGEAHLVTTLPKDLEIGKQSIEIEGISKDGKRQGAAIPLTVSEPLPMWMYLTMGATALLLVLSLLGIIIAKRKLR